MPQLRRPHPAARLELALAGTHDPSVRNVPLVPVEELGVRIFPKCPVCGKKVTWTDYSSKLEELRVLADRIYPSSKFVLLPCSHELSPDYRLVCRKKGGVLWWSTELARSWE